MKLIKYPNLVLTQEAVEWDFENDISAEEVADQLIELMVASNGIGLAANQVGLLKRVFAIKLVDKEPIVMFNPRVISESADVVSHEEGCLSFPNLWLEIKRPRQIESEYFDKQGNSCTITLSGIDCRCFLHELDHLNGVCFTEKISPLKLALAKKKQQKRKYNG